MSRQHVDFCGWRPGMYHSEYFGGTFAKLATPSIVGLGVGAAGGWLIPLLAGAALTVVPIVHSVKFTQRVPEFSYGVVSREDMVLPDTWGSGIHTSLPGDQVFVIKTNPIPITITVMRQTKDGREAFVTLQITVTPHPRIANEQGKNTYGSWVIEDDISHAQSHVRDAIVKPLSGILTNVIGQCTSDQLDEWNLGLALLVEGEVALHKAPHHLAGTVHGLPAMNEEKLILKWYYDHHQAIREFLDSAEEAFEMALADGDLAVAAVFLSHHEIHVGCVFNGAEVVTVGYDKATTEAKKAAYIAKMNALAVRPLMTEIDRATGRLLKKGVNPNAAAMVAAAAAKLQGVTVDGKVYTGAGSDIVKAGVAGSEAGGAMRGGH